jgi:hypothetical protein
MTWASWCAPRCRRQFLPDRRRRAVARFQIRDAALLVVQRRPALAVGHGKAVVQRVVSVGDHFDAFFEALGNHLEVSTRALAFFLDQQLDFVFRREGLEIILRREGLEVVFGREGREVVPHVREILFCSKRRQNLLDAFRPCVEIFDESFDFQLIHRLTTPCG